MAEELRVPSVGESITEVQVGEWLKAEGDYADRDDAIVEIESDKATVELVAPVAGVISKVLKKTGESANVGEVIGYLEESEAPAERPAAKPAGPAEAPAEPIAQAGDNGGEAHVMPAAKRMMAEKGVAADQVKGTGPRGRVLKEDVINAASAEAAAAPSKPTPTPAPAPTPVVASGPREVESVRMSPMRRTIAARLVEVQQTAAMLTTFNEVDMSAVMALRKEYQEDFMKRYEIKLGFMSFFVKAVVDALKQFPNVNAYIDGENILYHNYQDIGIAVGGGKGLVVPVIRNAERLSFAEIEKTIADFGVRAKANKIGLDELQGGTFSISNGGIYGSMLSTPILNPPQSGILGLHNILERPMAVNGEVVVRPMMYVALTYDHRIVDGREAVTFLRRVKDCIEKPSRMLVEI